MRALKISPYFQLFKDMKWQLPPFKKFLVTLSFLVSLFIVFFTEKDAIIHHQVSHEVWHYSQTAGVVVFKERKLVQCRLILIESK